MKDPFELFKEWFSEAKAKESSYPEAFALSTVSPKGQASSRTLLLRGVGDDHFTFYTNYNSKKGTELGQNNKASMLLYWKTTQKQIRIQGKCSLASEEVSDAYWKNRPYESRLHAFVSKQSSSMDLSESDINSLFEEIRAKYPVDIPRPKHWGGFDLKPDYFEFWQEGDFRWHQRESYTLKDGQWEVKSLYP